MIRTYALSVLVVVVLGRLAFSVGAATPNEIGTVASPPNIVLIISDDQGWGDFSFMGHPHIKTPNLDRLASESLTFTHGYVPSSLCCPSLASIITGLYPHQHKVTSNDPIGPKGMKPAEFRKSAAFQEGREIMNRHLEAVPTLPRLLAEDGYVSLQTGKWWQGNLQPRRIHRRHDQRRTARRRRTRHRPPRRCNRFTISWPRPSTTRNRFLSGTRR